MPCCILRWTLERLCRLHRQPVVDGTIGRYRSCLHSPVVVEEKEEMLAKKEKKAKGWIKKDEQLTGNSRKGLEGEEVPEGGKEMILKCARRGKIR